MNSKHCCQEMDSALIEQSLPLVYEFIDEVGPHYGLWISEEAGASCINYCPFCGKALPGALVTDWELHEKCERCHWTGPRDSDKMPSCICSKGYKELKRIQDEANKSN